MGPVGGGARAPQSVRVPAGVYFHEDKYAGGVPTKTAVPVGSLHPLQGRAVSKWANGRPRLAGDPQSVSEGVPTFRATGALQLMTSQA